VQAIEVAGEEQIVFGSRDLSRAEAGRAGLAKSGWQLRCPVGEKKRPCHRAGLHHRRRAIPRIFLPNFEGAGTGGTTGRDRLRRERRDDRRIRAGRGASRIRGDRSKKNLHGEPGRRCLRERSWIGELERIHKNVKMKRFNPDNSWTPVPEDVE
jgi:hypothetical protein